MVAVPRDLDPLFNRSEKPSRADVVDKWQTIQDNIADLGPDALRDLMADLVRTLIEEGGVVTDNVLSVVDSWYRRALIVAADRVNPVDSDSDQWIPADRITGSDVP